MSSFVAVERFPQIIFDDNFNVEEAVRRIVGKNHPYNVSLEIPFQFIGSPRTNQKSVTPKLVGCLPWETGKKAAERLVGTGYILGCANKLLQVALCCPEKISQYSNVFVLNQESVWENSDGDACSLCINIESSTWCVESFRLDKPLLGDRVAVLVF